MAGVVGTSGTTPAPGAGAQSDREELQSGDGGVAKPVTGGPFQANTSSCAEEDGLGSFDVELLASPRGLHGDGYPIRTDAESGRSLNRCSPTSSKKVLEKCITRRCLPQQPRRDTSRPLRRASSGRRQRTATGSVGPDRLRAQDRNRPAAHPTRSGFRRSVSTIGSSTGSSSSRHASSAGKKALGYQKDHMSMRRDGQGTDEIQGHATWAVVHRPTTPSRTSYPPR